MKTTSQFLYPDSAHNQLVSGHYRTHLDSQIVGKQTRISLATEKVLCEFPYNIEYAYSGFRKMSKRKIGLAAKGFRMHEGKGHDP